MSNSDLYQALHDFFTSTVHLTTAPPTVELNSIWWEDRGDGWLYPWRICANDDNGVFGYPRGEPIQK